MEGRPTIGKVNAGNASSFLSTSKGGHHPTLFPLLSTWSSVALFWSSERPERFITGYMPEPAKSGNKKGGT